MWQRGTSAIAVDFAISLFLFFSFSLLRLMLIIELYFALFKAQSMHT